MKKILMILLAGVLALSLTGCMGGSANKETLVTLEVPEEGTPAAVAPNADQYDADLAGLCAYMEAGGIIAAGEGYPVDTAYEVIGAMGGKRYKVSFNKSVIQAEFYEFDPENLSAEAQALLADAREQGQVTILRNTVPARASQDGKFMMIYIDPKTEEPDNAHRELAYSYFDNFCQKKQ